MGGWGLRQWVWACAYLCACACGCACVLICAELRSLLAKCAKQPERMAHHHGGHQHPSRRGVEAPVTVGVTAYYMILHVVSACLNMSEYV